MLYGAFMSEITYVGIQKAAIYLNLTPQYIRVLVMRGKLEAYKPECGGRLRFTREQLDRYAMGKKFVSNPTVMNSVAAPRRTAPTDVIKRRW